MLVVRGFGANPKQVWKWRWCEGLRGDASKAKNIELGYMG